ncbi:hypothetical protein BRDID11002_60280 [Bradyrhizobium diazoefficiens]
MLDVPELTADEILGRVLHRDGLMLVIDKPAGLPVHQRPQGRRQSGGILRPRSRFGLPRPAGAGPPAGQGTPPVASSSAAIARRPASLGLLFKHGKIGKTYWTVVEGGPAEDEGTIDMPLGRLNAERGWWQKPDPEGQKAITNWKVMGRGDGFTWLAMEPVTGRTHQLRVHSAATGWPIFGDNIYGNGPRFGEAEAAPALPRDRSADLPEQGAGSAWWPPAPPHMHEKLRGLRVERGVAAVSPLPLAREGAQRRRGKHFVLLGPWFTKRSGLASNDSGCLEQAFRPIRSGRAARHVQGRAIDHRRGVESALRIGSAEQGLETARRVTDLFPVLRRQF